MTKGGNFLNRYMITFTIQNNTNTKKACRGRRFLVEVASFKAKLPSFINDCSFMPQILRGNTGALQKLLLHTSMQSIATRRHKSIVIHRLQNI